MAGRGQQGEEVLFDELLLVMVANICIDVDL